MHTLAWRFRNDHEWSKTFDDLDQLVDFLHRCGLVSHPDIVWIARLDPMGTEQVLKAVKL